MEGAIFILRQAQDEVCEAQRVPSPRRGEGGAGLQNVPRPGFYLQLQNPLIPGQPALAKARAGAGSDLLPNGEKGRESTLMVILSNPYGRGGFPS